MTYDEAIKRLEDIVQSMQATEALSMEDYKNKAQEAKQLIQFCQKQLTTLETELKDALQ